MDLGDAACWARLARARHGVLATVHPTRGVDAVPVVFAVADNGQGPRIFLPVDTVKPKRSTRLQRVANIKADPRCVFLVDHYDDDWSQLWWVRVHAVATWSEDEVAPGLAALFPQYGTPGALVGTITLLPTEVRGWSA